MESVWEAIESAWESVLDLTEQLVMPDWSVIVSMIPVLLAILVALSLIWFVRRWTTAGPRQRGPGRRTPAPPAGIHMPGPSLSPFLAAAGGFLLFLGLIVGGWALWLGLVFLVAALLYWLREATREYDHLEPVDGELPAGTHAGPPPGVHVPGPSFRPLLVSLAAFVTFAGLVVGPLLLVTGFLLLVLALLGWLRDARREYALAVEADRTGHLRNPPEPAFPGRALAVGAIVVAAAFAIQTGAFSPTGDAVGGDGSPAPSAPAASGEPGGSAAPSAAPSQVSADVVITAKGVAFMESEVTAPAGRPFTLALVNLDAGVPHNVAIREGSPSGPDVYTGEIFNGVETKVYDVPALQAGTYGFVCTVHPNMTGTLTAQ